MNTWATNIDGSITVDDAVPELAPADLAVFRSRVMRWRQSAAKHAQTWSVPLHWVLAVIFAESNGNPNVVSPDHGYGLMQLTSPSVFMGHKPQETLTNPDLNIFLGTKYLGQLRAMGLDLPRAASGYNAGTANGAPHPSPSSPWGLRETKGYISRVVRAANTALRELGQGSDEPPKAEGPSPKAGSGHLLALSLAALAKLHRAW